MIGLLVLVAILLAGCSGPSAPPAGPGPAPAAAGPQSAGRLHFVDHTEAAGINFTYRCGSQPAYAPILEDLGGGCGLLDIDRDGSLDVFFPGGGFMSESGPQPFPHGMFLNRGDATFRDVSESSGTKRGRFYSHGVASTDYDADGFPDLLVTGYGGLQLLQNQGDGTFTEQTTAAGLTDQLWSTSAAWGDVNGDGNPDLYVCHYVDWSPKKNDPVCPGPTPQTPESCPPIYFKGLPHTLYLSKGTGEFDGISKVAGLRGDGKGLGVVMADLDADHDVDIYVANDTVANFLYRNEGNDPTGIPRFQEIGSESGTALSGTGTADGSMGISILDLNQDSRPDLWVSNFEFETPGLYRNDGNATFTHITRAAGLANRSSSYVSFGTIAADFDGDGDSDVMVTNGHISRYPRNGNLMQPCQLFENLGNSAFRDSAATAGDCLTIPRIGRGLAAGDIDGDGDPDAILAPKDQQARILKNTQSSVSRWVKLNLVGTTSPRDGSGAVVTVIRGTTRTKIMLYGGESYLSASATGWSFPDTEPSNSLELEVVWPAGGLQRLSRRASSSTAQWTVDCGSCRQSGNTLDIAEPASRKF